MEEINQNTSFAVILKSSFAVILFLPGGLPPPLETKPVNSFHPVCRVSSVRALYLRLHIRSLLGGAGQGAGTQPLPGLLDLLQVAFYVRELRDPFCLGCQLLCLLQQLSKAFRVHLCCRFRSRHTETFREKGKNSCSAINSFYTCRVTDRPARAGLLEQDTLSILPRHYTSNPFKWSFKRAFPCRTTVYGSVRSGRQMPYNSSYFALIQRRVKVEKSL